MNITDNLFSGNAEVPKRPKLITILCWLTFIFFPLYVLILIFLVAVSEKNITFDSQMGGIVMNSIYIGIPVFIGAIGMYKMKKWGAWLYIGAQAISAFMSFSQSANYNPLSVSPFIAFVIPGLCIGVVVYYYKYFTDNTTTIPTTTPAEATGIPITTAANLTNKPSRSDLLNKLEQLHKMKSEGKLSEEEFSIMKNKVMSELTGIEIKPEQETKKNSVEAAIIEQEENQNPAGPTGQIEKIFQMKEKGIISEDDFKTLKEEIIKGN